MEFSSTPFRLSEDPALPELLWGSDISNTFIPLGKQMSLEDWEINIKAITEHVQKMDLYQTYITCSSSYHSPIL